MDRLVGTDWLEKQVGSPDLRVLDRTVTIERLPGGGVEIGSGRAGWEQGHIPGSQHVPGQVITYCGAAIAASSAAFAMGLIGFDGVAIYDGSMVEWAADPSLPLALAGA